MTLQQTLQTFDALDHERAALAQAVAAIHADQGLALGRAERDRAVAQVVRPVARRREPPRRGRVSRGATWAPYGLMGSVVLLIGSLVVANVHQANVHHEALTLAIATQDAWLAIAAQHPRVSPTPGFQGQRRTDGVDLAVVRQMGQTLAGAIEHPPVANPPGFQVQRGAGGVDLTVPLPADGGEACFRVGMGLMGLAQDLHLNGQAIHSGLDVGVACQGASSPLAIHARLPGS